MYVILLDAYRQSDYWVSSGEFTALDEARNATVWDGAPSSFPKSRWEVAHVEAKVNGLFNAVTGQDEAPGGIYELHQASLV